MTAFVVEALLLIAAAFGIGVCLGLMLGRRQRARARRELPAAAPSSPSAGIVAAAPVADPHPAPALVGAEGEEMPPSLAVVEVAPAPVERESAIPNGAIGTARDGEGGRPLPGVRPPAEAPVAGAPVDDLKRLKGIGPLNEQRLHALGIHHFRQIAAWTPAEVEWVGSYLAFPGRIEREDWVGQARAIVAGTAPEALRMPPRKSR